MSKNLLVCIGLSLIAKRGEERGGGVVRTLYEYVGGGVQLDSGWVTPDSVQLQCITLV